VRRAVSLFASCTALALAPRARADAELPGRTIPPPDESYTYQNPQYYPTAVWVLTQLVPSPEVGIGRIRKFDVAGNESAETRTTFGLRWQLTPLLWSWGTNRHLDRWRFFVVDPLARSAGSIGFDTKIEYFFGDINRFLVRPGVHATFPLAHRGEYLSASIGTSIYQYDDTMRVSYDAGAYILYGILGLEMSYAPTHAPLRYVATVRIRYF
jgi:hypothetical protein